MFLYSDKLPVNPQVVKIRDNIYKITFRENVLFHENEKYYSYDEYSYVTEFKGDNDAETMVMENYDWYLSIAKLMNDECEKKEKISTAKKALNNSDYMILKNLESYALGLPLPYDYSALIAKRQELRDDINNLTETNISESTELVQCRSRKITEMCAICQTTITNGIDYNGAHYRLNTTDQINLTSLYTLAQTGKSVPYHADGDICRMFTPEEFIPLVQNSIQWITYHTTYYNLLKHQIANMDTIEEVEAVSYGMALKEDYQAVIDAIVGGVS